MTNAVYHNNLEVLKERFPKIYMQLNAESRRLRLPVTSFVTSQDQANAFVDLAANQRVLFYEDEDIINGTEQLMADWHLQAEDMLFCVGVGLGYYPLAAVNRFKTQPHIVIIEPHTAIFDLALQALDLRPLLNYEWLDIFIGKQASAADIVNHYSRKIFVGKQRLITHLPSRIIEGEDFITLENELKDLVSLTRDLWQTNRDLGRGMLANLMSNLTALIHGATLDKVKGVLAGYPGLCVSAGPSLEGAVAAIKALQDKVLIFALDSAVSTLVPAGIRPHFVVTSDARKTNFKKIRPYLDFLRQSVLIFALEANADNVSKFPGTKRLAVASNNLFVTSWLAPGLKIDCNLPAMSTVSHTAIYTMMALGVEPIIVTGMDMAFSKSGSHAANAVNKYNVAEENTIEVAGTNGLPVRTYRPLIDYTRQLEGVLANGSRHVINTCLNGMYIDGMQVKSLEEVAESKLIDALDCNHLLDKINWEFPLSEADMLATLISKRRELEKYLDQCLQAFNQAGKNVGRLNQKQAGNGFNVSVDAIKKTYQDFQEKNKKLDRLIMSISLQAFKDVEIRRLRLERRRAEVDDDIAAIKTLQIIKDAFAWRQEAAAFFYGLIVEQENFFEKVLMLKNEIKTNPQNHNCKLQLARLYGKAGQTAPAETYYLELLESSPDDVQVLLELARLYINSQLLYSARKLVNKICRDFPGTPEAATLKAEVDEAVSKVKQLVKESLAQGDEDASQRLLNEYLLLFPEDQQPELLRKIKAGTDVESEHHSTVSEKFEITAKQFNALLAKAARRIENMQFEQAIGIMEGLIASFPAKTCVLRGKIGDLRLLQQDYPSALWNYRQVLDRSPGAIEIKNKIETVRQKMDLGNCDLRFPAEALRQTTI